MEIREPRWRSRRNPNPRPGVKEPPSIVGTEIQLSEKMKSCPFGRRIHLVAIAPFMDTLGTWYRDRQIATFV